MGHMRAPRQATTRAFLAVFVPLLLIIGANLTFLLRREMVAEQRAIEEKGWWAVATATELVQREFASVIADLRFLADANEIRAYVRDSEAPQEHLEGLATEFLRFMETRARYDQIRFLDDTGMELARVNYNDGAPSIVPGKDLQFKGHRYYFSDSISQPEGQVFVSPFDLNVERGAIELPHKPMIRFGMPVLDKTGSPRGVVLINYLGQHLLDDLVKLGADLPVDVYLLNSGGHWFIGPTAEVEWGFMHPDSQERGMWAVFPDEWDAIEGVDSGQFHTANGVFTVQRISPLRKGWQSSTGSGSAYGSSAHSVTADEYEWVFLTVAPSAVVRQIRKEFLRRSSLTIAICLVASLAISCLIALSRTRRLRAELSLRESNATKDRLFSILAHDLRGPLASIASLSQMISEDLEQISGESLREAVDALRDSARNEYDLLSTLLTWSRSQLGTIEFSPAHVPLALTMREALEHVRAAARTKSVSIITETPPADATVYADADMLGLVFRNLFANAVKFTPNGGAVTVSASYQSGNWTITVADTGVGIPDEYRGELFTVGNTYRRQGTAGEPSTGLGLVLCREFVERNGGTISVESSLGQGSSFSVELPGSGGDPDVSTTLWKEATHGVWEKRVMAAQDSR